MTEENRLWRIVETRVFEDNGKKKIKCGDALAVAAAHQVDAQEIGRICTAKGVKICQCSLGCFK